MVGLVVSSFATSKDSNILPCYSWVHFHFMDFAAYSLVPLSLCNFHQVVIVFVDKFQLCLDGGYLVGIETATIVEAVTQAIILLDGRRKDVFTCRVPSFSFLINGDGNFFASTHYCFAEMRREFQKILVV